MQKEAKARIKINALLNKSGWRFFDDESGPANIQLEVNVKIKKKSIDEMGEDFEKTANGYADYLLLDDKGFPCAVLEAKSEKIDPLVAKEQARKYARSLNVRFIILSNGNLHYLWDLEQGNPTIITAFPSQESLFRHQSFKPDPASLVKKSIQSDYIALTQDPAYMNSPRWNDPDERDAFIKENNFKFLRGYQIKAVQKLQEAVAKGMSRFLFEMATGTGKTLTAAAVIKLFLRTGNASRVLFLVDRLELENQAWKNLVRYLKNDYTCVIYKENRDDWRKAEIVVTTVQSLSFNNKYRKLFSPMDFDLVISDEAHRSINGNSRAVFEYYIGYKLGLTATPKDYLKKIDPAWPMVKLVKLCSMEYGYTAKGETKGDTRFVRITDISLNGELINDDPKYINLSNNSKPYLLKKGDVLIARTGASYGKTIVFDLDKQCVFASFLIRLSFSYDKVLPEFFGIFSLTEFYWKQAKDLVTGGGQPQFNANVIKKIHMSVPPLNIQKKIVAEIEAERELVDANKKLIKIFEKKIRDKIGEVWGE